MTAELIWKILLVDDDEDDYLITKDMLAETRGRKTSLEWASTFDQGRLALATPCHDAVLMDYDLITGSGLDLIREAVANDYPAPLILLTGRGSYDVDVEAMQAGATMYLTKSEINPLLLERAIRYSIERKRIEQERAHLLESIQDGFFALDQDWRVVYINHTAAKANNYRPEEVIGRIFWEAFPRLLGTQVEQIYRNAMDTRKPVKFELAGIYQGAWFNVSIFPFLEGLTIYWQDITERKRAEQSLRSSEATLRGILNATKESIWLFGTDGTILMANETAASRFHLSLEEMVGKHFSLFMTAELAQRRQERLARTIESRQPLEFVDEPDGIVFRHVFYPVFDASGEVTSVAVFSRDITRQGDTETRRQGDAVTG